MQLSLRSRTTSISYSFQPNTDSSINNSLVGERSNPRSQISMNSSRLYEMPPPLPPMVNEGRIIVGKPISSSATKASSILCATNERGVDKPILVIAFLNKSRSSALSIASLDAPIISTLCLAKTPWRSKSRAQLSAV